MSMGPAGTRSVSPRPTGQTVAMGRAGEKPRRRKRRLAKVPKYEVPKPIDAAGLTAWG